jgi:hypothetical protein
VPVPEGSVFSVLLQTLLRVLPDGLEHPEAYPPLSRCLRRHQRLLNQPREQIQHVAFLDAASRSHRLGRLNRPASSER